MADRTDRHFLSCPKWKDLNASCNCVARFVPDSRRQARIDLVKGCAYLLLGGLLLLASWAMIVWVFVKVARLAWG